MPVMLMTPDDVEQWLQGSSVEDALKMQKPAPDDAVVIRPAEKKAAERGPPRSRPAGSLAGRVLASTFSFAKMGGLGKRA
jgi:hypothetical protein